MLKKLDIAYNPFFFIPFLLWVVAGGILLFIFSREDLFFAVNRNYTDTGDVIMYYITFLGQGEVIVPVLLLLMMFPKFRNGQYVFLASCCNLIPFLIQQLLKSIFNHPRPELLYHNRYWIHYLSGWPVLYGRGFPSGHSAGAFSFFCFLSLLLPVQYRKYGLLFFLLALSVCYSRIYLAAHFFEDVYMGSVMGTVITTLVYSVMDKNKKLRPE